MRNRAFSLLLVALVAPVWAQTVPSEADIAKIIDEGKNRNQVMRTLKGLTDIGPRLTGSPKLAKAQQWAMDKFRRAGCTNVHLEQWGETPFGFERGGRQAGRMVRPFVSEFEFTTSNWAPGTNGLVRAKALRNPKDQAEFDARKDEYKGAWIVMPKPTSPRGPIEATGDVDKALDALGIAGRVYGANSELVLSSGNWRGKTFESRPTQVNVTVRKSDYDRITRNIDLERNPEIEFDLENKWFKGAVPQYNVVAEIPGSDLKDEVVIVCGHLDSWNTPGSQGACDNGTGSSVAIEAARILGKAQVKPRRTIRFILWSGEEQGLLGSRGYVEKHKDELPKIVAVLNDDGGSGYQGGYNGLAAHKPILEAAFAPVVAAFPEMPQTVAVVDKYNGGGSSDHAPFAWAGVPAYFTMEKGPKANYQFVWHTQNDKYENAVPEYLVQSSTNHAVVSFYLATIDQTLARFEPRATAVSLNHDLAVGADHMYEDPRNHAMHDHTDDFVLELVDRLQRFGARLFRVAW